MVDFLKLLTNSLPPTTSSTFALVIILSILYIIGHFAFKFYEFSSQINMLKEDEEQKNDQKKDVDIDMAFKLLEKVTELRENLIGRSVTLEEFEQFKDDINKRLLIIEEAIKAKESKKKQ